MVIYEITSKNIGYLFAFMSELKARDKRNGNYNSNNYKIDRGRKILQVNNVDSCVLEKVGRKYTNCKIIQL
jgi:hypothetical protein